MGRLISGLQGTKCSYVPAHNHTYALKQYRKLKKASVHEPEMWLHMYVLKFTIRIALRTLSNESARIYMYRFQSYHRDRVAAARSSSDEDDGPPLQRRRLHELVRENREVYNVFTTRRLPRILKDYRKRSVRRHFE